MKSAANINRKKKKGIYSDVYIPFNFIYVLFYWITIDWMTEFIGQDAYNILISIAVISLDNNIKYTLIHMFHLLSIIFYINNI